MKAKTLQARWNEGYFDKFLEESPSFGLRTGCASIDQLTTGLDGVSFLVSAKPGDGKTSLVVDVAVCAAMEGTSVVLVSLEESPFSTSSRLLARIAGRTVPEVRKGVSGPARKQVDTWMAAHGARLRLVGINDLPTPSSIATGFAKSELVIIDSLQHFAEHFGTGRSAKERIDAALLLFRRCVAVGGSSFLVLSQVGMNGIGAGVFFGGSSRIGFDADTILVLRRLPGDKAELRATKQRVSTAKTSIRLRYIRAESRFEVIR